MAVCRSENLSWASLDFEKVTPSPLGLGVTFLRSRQAVFSMTDGSFDPSQTPRGAIRWNEERKRAHAQTLVRRYLEPIEPATPDRLTMNVFGP